MGKRLRQQRRGKGSNAYRKPPNTFKADVSFIAEKRGTLLNGEVLELIDDPGHSAPLMLVEFSNGERSMLIAPEGIYVGSTIQQGESAAIALGNILPLKNIPDGTPVYNIEVLPGDGGKMARSAGSYADVVSHANGKVSVRLPSKTVIELDENCRAEIGVSAGGGMKIQPIMKAGKNYYIKHAINATWPKNRGVKSNPVDHPFGGKQHHKGASSISSRHAPPGAKVGQIAARRVGRRKRG
ncbi:MAG: 50S ribosomal protein L2 [Candidatus Micrarchaeaceae archaeon]